MKSYHIRSSRIECVVVAQLRRRKTSPGGGTSLPGREGGEPYPCEWWGGNREEQDGDRGGGERDFNQFLYTHRYVYIPLYTSSLPAPGLPVKYDSLRINERIQTERIDLLRKVPSKSELFAVDFSYICQVCNRVQCVRTAAKANDLTQIFLFQDPVDTAI